jgi:hypothetical protein
MVYGELLMVGEERMKDESVKEEIPMAVGRKG